MIILFLSAVYHWAYRYDYAPVCVHARVHVCSNKLRPKFGLKDFWRLGWKKSSSKHWKFYAHHIANLLSETGACHASESVNNRDQYLLAMPSFLWSPTIVGNMLALSQVDCRPKHKMSSVLTYNHSTAPDKRSVGHWLTSSNVELYARRRHSTTSAVGKITDCRSSRKVSSSAASIQ